MAAEVDILIWRSSQITPVAGHICVQLKDCLLVWGGSGWRNRSIEDQPPPMVVDGDQDDDAFDDNEVMINDDDDDLDDENMFAMSFRRAQSLYFYPTLMNAGVSNESDAIW